MLRPRLTFRLIYGPISLIYFLPFCQFIKCCSRLVVLQPGCSAGSTWVYWNISWSVLHQTELRFISRNCLILTNVSTTTVQLWITLSQSADIWQTIIQRLLPVTGADQVETSIMSRITPSNLLIIIYTNIKSPSCPQCCSKKYNWGIIIRQEACHWLC